MNGYRRWAWGRDADGAIWMTLGPRLVRGWCRRDGSASSTSATCTRCIWKHCCQNFLKHCSVGADRKGPAGTDIITAVPRRRWSERPLKRAMIEVDRESKAIRRLVVERGFPDQSSTIVTFTLVDSRLADEAMYRPQGHLKEPNRIFASDTDSARRRELIVNWFGTSAERWIQIPEAASNDH
ncbi:MAG: hypothetical protein R3C20_05825 [Planctomycetaceae bacterium]